MTSLLICFYVFLVSGVLDALTTDISHFLYSSINCTWISMLLDRNSFSNDTVCMFDIYFTKLN